VDALSKAYIEGRSVSGMGAIWEFRVKKGHFGALVSALFSMGCGGHF
jgi:hypothetical protein